MLNRNKKRGFTIIEVTFFLAISGALLAMVIAGNSISVARRRYNDAVNDLVEQIRNAYSATINVQNSRKNTEGSSRFCSISSAFSDSNTLSENGKDTDNYPGRTRCAVYGQLLTFGEEGDGEKPDAMVIHRYDIIGKALYDDISPVDSDNLDSTLVSLKDDAKANVVTIKKNKDQFMVQLSGNTESYRTQWDATIEEVETREPYIGAIMIVRSPVSGTVHTYSYKAEKKNDDSNNELEIQKFLKENSKQTNNAMDFKKYSNKFLAEVINKSTPGNKMENKDTIICVGSDDLYALSNRRAIKIHGDGSTEAAVELLPLDEGEEKCKK